jgi:hypothetical protein
MQCKLVLVATPRSSELCLITCTGHPVDLNLICMHDDMQSARAVGLLLPFYGGGGNGRHKQKSRLNVKVHRLFLVAWVVLLCSCSAVLPSLVINRCVAFKVTQLLNVEGGGSDNTAPVFPWGFYGVGGRHKQTTAVGECPASWT